MKSSKRLQFAAILALLTGILFFSCNNSAQHTRAVEFYAKIDSSFNEVVVETEHFDNLLEKYVNADVDPSAKDSFQNALDLIIKAVRNGKKRIGGIQEFDENLKLKERTERLLSQTEIVYSETIPLNIKVFTLGKGAVSQDQFDSMINKLQTVVNAGENLTQLGKEFAEKYKITDEDIANYEKRTRSPN